MKKSTSSAINKIVSKTAQNVSKKMSGNGSFLYNKYLLYISFVVAFINILIWISSGDYFHVIVFFLVGYLTYQFSKNMMVVLVIAFIISNIVKSGSSIVLEGMEAGQEKEDKKKEGMEAGQKKQDKKKEGMKQDKKKEDKKECRKEKKKEGMKDSKNKEGMAKSENESLDQYEGLDDEEPEGLDNKKCSNDSECNNGDICDMSSFLCITKK